MSVTVPALLVVNRSSETIVVPGGTSPMLITFPTTLCVEDCIAKFERRIGAWMVAPWAVADFELIMVKLTVILVFILAEEGYDTVRLRTGVGVGVGVGLFTFWNRFVK